MPTHPLTKISRHRRTGEWDRIQNLSEGGRPKPEVRLLKDTDADPAFVKIREKGGLMISRGKTYVLLDQLEVEKLIAIAHDNRTDQRDPPRQPRLAVPRTTCP